ncbi:uncharacterized protein LOC132540379 isoform X4 [Erinaceus europaeus]|uniref:Uncharacterized protein LOC132540379 isoform X4 n=1 Tax=Erinaceus europaeus TaxID=9365 RepID=A0ABM3XXQ0_ERIEU|nr:uncharacterized protein LOC132540379 isoform X4 [Erinaceus europaeus]
MAEPGSAQARSRAGANSGHLWTAPTAAAPNQRCEEVGLIRERLPGIGRHGAVVNPVRLGERARLPDSRTLPDTSASVKRKWKQPERTSTRSCRTLPRINVHIQTISLFIAMEEAGKDNPPGMHGILSFLLCWPRNELRTSYSCMITPLSSLPGSTFSFFISLKGQGEQGGVQIEKANIIAPLHRSWRFPLCCDRT